MRTQVKEERAHPLPKRRKRSHLTKTQAIKEVELFARRMERMLESSDTAAFGFSSHPNKTCISFLVPGRFGVATGLFEALRIFAGYKLPAVEKGV